MPSAASPLALNPPVPQLPDLHPPPQSSRLLFHHHHYNHYQPSKMSTPKTMRAARIVEVPPFSALHQSDHRSTNHTPSTQSPSPNQREKTSSSKSAPHPSVTPTHSPSMDPGPLKNPVQGPMRAQGQSQNSGRTSLPELGFKVGDRVGLHCFYHLCGPSPHPIHTHSSDVWEWG